MFSNIIQKFRRLYYMFASELNIKDKNINVYKNNKEKFYEIIKDNKIIKISLNNSVTLYDIICDFDYYFSAVEPVETDEFLVVDYSKPLLHNVVGYELHPVYCPSAMEPLNIAEQYIDFAKINENSVVIDLGAYAGLTSILFDQTISSNNNNAKGIVIAVEADKTNLSCLIKNLELYKNSTNRNIEYFYSAISDKDGTVEFLSESNMSSNAVTKNIIIKKLRKGTIIKVPAITLHSLAEKYNLDKIDFIKCDIEGSEKYIFEDNLFFEKYSPRIIVETHSVNGIMTTDTVIKTLKKYGYSSTKLEQNGSQYPLLCFEKDNVN